MPIEVNPRKVLAISRKEFMDNVRNRWSMALTVIFIILTLVVSYFGAAQGGGKVGFQGFEGTVVGIASITSFLLPLIAIMQGYGSIIGEQENGSLGVVLACPVSRYDLILGKFIGLGSVMFFTIFAGFGSAGVFIALLSSAADWPVYIAFMFCTLIFTMLYLGFSILMSAVASKRSTAIAGGVLLFFSGMILGIIMIGVWSATSGQSLADIISNPNFTFPDWFWLMELFNFMDVYSLGAMLMFGIHEYMGYTMTTPGWVTPYTIFGLQFAVALACFLLSMWVMGRKDL